MLLVLQCKSGLEFRSGVYIMRMHNILQASTNTQAGAVRPSRQLTAYGHKRQDCLHLHEACC